MPKVQSFDHEKGGHSRRGRRTSSSLAEINVVPLVDVMLVLLIIFMVTAPMMQRGVEIQLPVARRGTAISAEPMFVTLPLSYRKDQRVFIGPEGKQEAVPISRTRRTCAADAGGRATKQVYLRMDAGANAQEILEVMDSLKDGGVEAIGIVALDAPNTIELMEAVVSDILHQRKRAPDGLMKTASISFAAHVIAVALLALVPASSPKRPLSHAW